jgi:hypothetical protein
MPTPRPLLLSFLLLLCSAASAQLFDQTHILEAYNCRCGPDGKATNSIQLAMRLDGTKTLHTALNSLVGCSRIFLNVDGERFPYHIALANGKDNVARLEPTEVGLKIAELEKRLKKAPRFDLLVPGMEQGAKVNVIILQGSGMSKQKRGLPEATLTVAHEGTALRYTFRMADRGEADIDFDRLMGGPVWIEKGKDHLVGLITRIEREAGGVKCTVTGVENIVDKSRTELVLAYVAALEDVPDDCGGRQVYWDGFSSYAFRKVDKVPYRRISKEEKWNKSLRTALMRIREHMRDSIPAKGKNREGEPSLCVFENDLEYVYLAFKEQASTQEQYDWAVLPRFVKAYSNVYCKPRKYGETEFVRDITELNYRVDRLSSEELRLLYELGYDWYAFEGFIKRYFLLSQVGSIRARYDRLMAEEDKVSDPCTQSRMLEELDNHAGNWARHVGLADDPHNEQLMAHLKTLAGLRDTFMAAQLASLEVDRDQLPAVLEGTERDSCLTEAERLRLMKIGRDLSVDHEREAMDYGLDLVEDVRMTVAKAFGENALGNVVTRLFRVEDGVGVELTIRGGGAILDKRLHGNSGQASDTTTVYRHGFPLGSVGDTLSATIAQVFWDRMCADYSSRRWQYRTESMEVIGMADGVPVRSTLSFAEECRQELTANRITDANAQLAYARAWSLRRQLMLGDRCGLYSLLEPSLSSIIHPERGGDYRGVTLRAVMKRK